MGLIGRSSKENGNQPGKTVIASGTKVVGEFKLKDDFHLDGEMSGKLTSDCDISIGVNGKFEGQINAGRVLISGTVEGSVDAKHLEILSTGVVKGDIQVAELVIEPGGQFNGNSTIKKPDSESRKVEDITELKAPLDSLKNQKSA